MIIVNLDVMLAKRKIRLSELSDAIGISLPNLSILKTGKAKAIRFSTLQAICRHLNCQPGDLLSYEEQESSPSTELAPKKDTATHQFYYQCTVKGS